MKYFQFMKTGTIIYDYFGALTGKARRLYLQEEFANEKTFELIPVRVYFCKHLDGCKAI